MATDKLSYRRLSPSDFVQQNSYLGSFLCQLCNHVLLKPVIDACGHNFCRECLEEHLAGNSKCPVTQEKLKNKEFQINTLVNKMLENELVYCKNRLFGCKYQGNYCLVLDHLNSCEFQNTFCPNEGCEFNCKRMFLKEHLNKCEMKLDKCHFCNKMLKKSALKFHYLKCSKALLGCPNKCGETIKRCEIRKHAEEDCSRLGSKCPFYDYGCSAEGMSDKEISNHSVSKLIEHNRIIAKQVERINQLEEELNILRDELHYAVDSLLARKREKEEIPKKKKKDPSFSLGTGTGKITKKSKPLLFKVELPKVNQPSIKENKQEEAKKVEKPVSPVKREEIMTSQPSFEMPLENKELSPNFKEELSSKNVLVKENIASFLRDEPCGLAVGETVLGDVSAKWHFKVLKGKGSVNFGLVKADFDFTQTDTDAFKKHSYFITSAGKVWDGEAYTWLYPDYYLNLEIHLELREGKYLKFARSGFHEEIPIQEGEYRPFVMFFEKKSTIALKNLVLI